MGRSILLDIVKPMFDKAQIEYHCIETQGRGHAKELMRTLELQVGWRLHFPPNTGQEFSGLVVVSGDGLLVEVINGLSLRYASSSTELELRFTNDTDHTNFFELLQSLPIAVVPAGDLLSLKEMTEDFNREL